MLDIALFLRNQVINLQTVFLLKTDMYRQILHTEPFLSNVEGLKVFVKQNEPLKRIIPSIAFFWTPCTIRCLVTYRVNISYIEYLEFPFSYSKFISFSHLDQAEQRNFDKYFGCSSRYHVFWTHQWRKQSLNSMDDILQEASSFNTLLWPPNPSCSMPPHNAFLNDHKNG